MHPNRSTLTKVNNCVTPVHFPINFKAKPSISAAVNPDLFRDIRVFIIQESEF